MHDAVAVPKIIDFGIAKALGRSLTEHTLHTGFAQLVGTPMYTSPEQAQMNQLGVDTRSDVYSLGVLLYELPTLILGIAVSAWQAVRATAAEGQAATNEQKAVANERKANENATQAQEKAQEATKQRDEAKRQRDEVRALNAKLQASQNELRRTLYIAHMNLAQRAWDDGNTGRVQNERA